MDIRNLRSDKIGNRNGHMDSGRVKASGYVRKILLVSLFAGSLVFAIENSERFPVHVTLTGSSLTIYTDENSVMCLVPD